MDAAAATAGRFFQSRPVLLSFMTGMPTATIITGVEGMIVYANPAAHHLFRFTLGTLVGHPVELLLPTLSSSEPSSQSSKSLSKGLEYPLGSHQRLTVNRRDGSALFADVALTHLSTPEGVFDVGLVVELPDQSTSLEEAARLAALIESSGDAIVATTPDGLIATWNRAATAMFGYAPAEVIGSHFRILISEAEREQDVVDTYHLGAEPILRLDRAVRKDGGEFDAMVTASLINDEHGRPLGQTAILRDVSAEVASRAALLVANTDLANSGRDLRLAFEELLARLSSATALRDEETGRHIERMSLYCSLIARKYGLETDRCDRIRAASRLHDVGKVGIPDMILRKPGPLNPEEYAIMQGHTTVGWRILAGSASELLEVAATIALSHHERWDGKGYPRSLAAEQIPLEGRIAAIGDAFDAMTSPRIYRAGRSIAEAVEVIRAASGTQFDPTLAALFLDSIDDASLIYRALF